MTNYMRNTLTKKYAKELVAIGELLRQQKELNVELTAGEAGPRARGLRLACVARRILF